MTCVQISNKREIFEIFDNQHEQQIPKLVLLLGTFLLYFSVNFQSSFLYETLKGKIRNRSIFQIYMLHETISMYNMSSFCKKMLRYRALIISLKTGIILPKIVYSHPGDTSHANCLDPSRQILHYRSKTSLYACLSSYQIIRIEIIQAWGEAFLWKQQNIAVLQIS